MNSEKLFDMLQRKEISSATIKNEDAIKFIDYILMRSALSRFKITINNEPGMTEIILIKH